MAVFPKRYSKKGHMSLEDFVIYMVEMIEHDSMTKDKRIRELEKMCKEQAEELAALKNIKG